MGFESVTVMTPSADDVNNKGRTEDHLPTVAH